MASVEFDDETSALYLRLRRGKTASSEPLADNIVLDRDENERVIGWRSFCLRRSRAK